MSDAEEKPADAVAEGAGVLVFTLAVPESLPPAMRNFCQYLVTQILGPQLAALPAREQDRFCIDTVAAMGCVAGALAAHAPMQLAREAGGDTSPVDARKDCLAVLLALFEKCFDATVEARTVAAAAAAMKH